MAQHGYLGDGYGMRGDHGGDDSDRDRYRERGFGDGERSYGERDGGFRDNGRDRDFGDRDRDFMFDRGRQQSRSHDDWDRGRREREGWGGDSNRMSGRRDHDDDRGLTDRARDTAQGWFGDDDDHRGGQQNRGWSGQNRPDERPTFGGFGNQTGWESSRGQDQGRSRPTPHRDDHYRSWRDKQMQALDREYEEYCRDCEQKFHQDFDSWRQNRQQQNGRGSQQSDESEQVRMGSNRPSIDSPRAGTDPNGSDGADFIGGAEVGVGGQADHGATSVGAGSELGGATGSMVNEGTGGGGRRKPV